MILELKKIKSVTASTFSASICYEVIGPGAMILSCFFLAVPVLHCCAGFSLAAASGDYSLVGAPASHCCRRKWHPAPVFLPGESQGRGAWWAAVCGVAQSRA